MEPAGILLEAAFPESALVPLLRSQIPYEGAHHSIGHVLSDLLRRGDEDGDILILHHDPDSGTLLLGWVLAHYDDALLAPIWPVVEAIAVRMAPDARGEGVLSTTFPEAFADLTLAGGRMDKRPASDQTQQRALTLSDRLWRFSKKDQFPDAAASMRRKDYHCKPFRRAWKRYLDWRARTELPARIAAATEDQPLRLLNATVTWGGKVYADHGRGKAKTELPGADPLSLRWAAGFYADDNHVWQRRLAASSPPPEVVNTYGHTVNNPDAIWTYVIVEGAIGRDFNWLDDPWDGMYWSDKRHIYTVTDDGLIPLPDVRAEDFTLHGWGFGATSTHVLNGATVLPLDPSRLNAHEHLIWDDNSVYVAGQEVPLSPAGLQVRGKVRLEINPPCTAYRVRNRDGSYLIQLDGTVWPDEAGGAAG